MRAIRVRNLFVIKLHPFAEIGWPRNGSFSADTRVRVRKPTRLWVIPASHSRPSEYEDRTFMSVSCLGLSGFFQRARCSVAIGCDTLPCDGLTFHLSSGFRAVYLLFRIASF